MKNIYEKTTQVKIIGTLDVDGDGEKFIRVEQKDEDDLIISVNDLLHDLIGTEIAIKSIEHEV